MRVDLHTHTHYSPDSILSPRRFVETCQRKGINCVAVTDPKTIRGALAVQELADFRVIVGEEIETSAGQVIGLFLREEVRPGLSPEETIERVRAMGGLVGVPHPCQARIVAWISANWRNDRLGLALRHDEIVRFLPQIGFMEVFNARVLFPRVNEKARRLARELDLAASAGSDAHSPWELGRAYVEMPEFEGPEDFLEALRKGEVVGRRSTRLVHLISLYAMLRRKLGWRPGD